MWLRSPETYIRRYIHGDAGFENSGMRFGKIASEALENGSDGTDVAMEALVALLPRYSEREHEIRVPFKSQYGEVILLGRLDTFKKPPKPKFREYKTGRVKWTQAKAQKHKQIPHYGALIWLQHNEVPEEAWLDWAETVEEDGEVRLTGNIQSFHVKLGMREILEYLAIVSRVAKEIDEAYRKELAKLA